MKKILIGLQRNENDAAPLCNGTPFPLLSNLDSLHQHLPKKHLP
jgi:hypothetical protein